jgi:glutamate---cysteine ligase / carboxylate-amine ligase
MQFTIGVEEEYQIVNEKGALIPRSNQVLESVQDELGQRAAHELFLAQVEIGTPVCASLNEVRQQIKRGRHAMIEAAQQNNARIIASGTHPFSHWKDQDVTPKERYLDMADAYAQLAREHLICGCHVHVGMDDRELAIGTMNRARGWLAPLVALTGNSPFWLGEDTEYSSFRTEVWRRWPMAGSPQPFSSRAEYDALIRVLVETGSISDETKIYWDMRPADRYETLEFRATDVCLTLDEAVLVAGLVRALAKTCFDLATLDLERDAVFVPARPELLRAAEWRAARFGLEDELIDVHSGERVAAMELVSRFLQFLRPALEELNDWDEVSTLTKQVLESGNGAMRQRATWRKNEGFQDVVNFIAQQTQKGIFD